MYYLSISGVNANGTCRFKIFLTCTQLGLGRKQIFQNAENINVCMLFGYYSLFVNKKKVWFYLQMIKQDKCNMKNFSKLLFFIIMDTETITAKDHVGQQAFYLSIKCTKIREVFNTMGTPLIIKFLKPNLNNHS